MNFSFDPSKTQTTPSTTAQSVSTGFKLGNLGASDAGKSMTNLSAMQSQPKLGSFFTPPATAASASTFVGLNLNTTAMQPTATPTTGLTFGGAATTTPTTGISFGMPTSTSSSTFSASNIRMPNTSFSSPLVPNTNTTGTGLRFGSPNITTTTGFASGSLPATISAPSFAFSAPAASIPASTGFSLGGTAATTSTPSTLSFGLMSTTASATPTSLLPPSTSGNLPTIVTTSAPTSTPGFNLATTINTTALSSSFSLGVATAATTTSSLNTFSPPSTITSVTTAGFNLGNTSTTNATGFSLNKTTTAPVTSTVPTSTAPQTSLGAITTVSASSSSGQTITINFCQLEEVVNKWTLELEEQEKIFMNQALQVNEWDKLLITNGEKIVMLNQEVERVKLEQQQLEHELDYVVGQQKELQDCLVPLEKELVTPTVSDPEREYTYRLAEKLDTQFKQMSEDLKEIIEHLNEANRAQDSSDPIVQIGKILNAHMNSLQWLDQRTSILEQNIQLIDQMHQNFRQENERSFSLAYN